MRRRRDNRAFGSGSPPPCQAAGHRSPRGAQAHLWAGLSGSARALPGGALEKGGRIPLRPWAPVCAAQGQVRGRAEVSGRSGWAARSAAAALKPRHLWLPPPPPPALKSRAPARWKPWGARPWGTRAGAASQTWAVGPSGHHPALALDSFASIGPAWGGLSSAITTTHPFLGFSRRGRNFLGHTPKI